MSILSIIDKKRYGLSLTREEIDFAFNGYLNNVIPDYQMSSLLMAICINGMDLEETINLTDIMMNSGKILDTSMINGVQVDKHSTGGIGDKTTLIIGPILASLGLKVAKMSGKGLGITGGTIDKLESIPGFRVSLSLEEFIKNTNEVGFSLMMQTPDITPLDKVIYELRDVSGTTESIPLIASSIMSKKLAVGAKYILIDIKVGEGALIKNRDDAIKLADIMVEIGNKYNKVVIPVLTNMDEPLGDNIGNALEVKEAIDVLRGKSGHLRDLCVDLSSILYSKSKNIELDLAREEVINVLNDGRAYNKFLEFIKTQGGDLESLTISDNVVSVKSIKEGILKSISSREIGYLSKKMGAGREKKNDTIDYGVGIVLKKHVGDKISKDDILCHLYQKDNTDYVEEALNAFDIVK